MGSSDKIESKRRSIFAIAALPLLVFGFGSRSRAAGACYDLQALPSGQRAQRTGVKFRASTDPNKRCGLCMYFSGSPTACGKCQILLNGPVAATDVCDAWTKKAS